MKIALLLSGLPRQWQPSLATQLDMFPNCEVDVFFHFWDVIPAAEKQQLLALTTPKAHYFEEPQDFSFMDNNPAIILDNINIPSRLASQYYSWNQVAELFKPYAQNYDCAIRSRSDLQFVYSVEYIAKQLKPGELMLPWWEEGKLIADIFAMGDPEAILYYLSLFDHLAEYSLTQSFNPEALVTHHLAQSPTPLKIYTDHPTCL